MARINLEWTYRAVENEIKGILMSIDIMKPIEVERIRRAVRRGIARLNAAAAAWVLREIPAACRLGARRARVALEILGKKSRSPSMTSPEVIIGGRALERLVAANNTIQTTVDKYLAMTIIASRVTRSAQVQEQLDPDDAMAVYEKYGHEAVLQMKSRGWLAARIREYLASRISEGGFIEVKGRYYNASKYAKMVARTEMARAQTEATLEVCREYGNDLVEVSDHATDCEVCQEYEGNVYSISGSHPSYPPLQDSPPYHPNCKHRLLPASEEAIAIRERFR